MPKPLLTDEVIEQAKQDKKNLERRLQRELEEDTEIAEKYELSKTPVEHKLGYDIWQLEPKDKDAAEHNSTFIFI